MYDSYLFLASEDCRFYLLASTPGLPKSQIDLEGPDRRLSLIIFWLWQTLSPPKVSHYKPFWK